jgi:adenosine deaminase
MIAYGEGAAGYGRPPGPPLAELHTHLGAAVDPAILYSIAHAQGIRLPGSGYWAFVEMVTANPRRVHTFDGYLNLFHWTELVQSSPDAMDTATHSVISSAYRLVNVDLIELRYCPAKRNRGGERDLDHIIFASLQGMQRALLEYDDVRAGLILCADRSLAPEVNEAIVRKAMRYHSLGVVGVDLAGPAVNTFGGVRRLAPLFSEARDAGLGVTIHTGEVGSVEEMWEALEHVKPQRIGHGVKAVEDPRLLERLAKEGVVLELCPTSNIRTGVVARLEDWHEIFAKLHEAGVRYCINTDGPQMLCTDLAQEHALLREANILTEEQLREADATARRASFIHADIPFVRRTSSR